MNTRDPVKGGTFILCGLVIGVLNQTEVWDHLLKEGALGLGSEDGWEVEDRGPWPVAFEGLKKGLLLDWPAGCLGRWVGVCPVLGTAYSMNRARCPDSVLILPSFSPQKWTEPQVTPTDDSDPWWAAFSGACRDM